MQNWIKKNVSGVFRGTGVMVLWWASQKGSSRVEFCHLFDGVDVCAYQSRCAFSIKTITITLYLFWMLAKSFTLTLVYKCVLWLISFDWFDRVRIKCPSSRHVLHLIMYITWVWSGPLIDFPADHIHTEYLYWQFSMTNWWALFFWADGPSAWYYQEQKSQNTCMVTWRLSDLHVKNLAIMLCRKELR